MMLSQFGCRLCVLLACYCVLSMGLFTSLAHAKQHSVAIFQFTASSMDVVGIENDVAYVVRNELRKNADLTLLNQREMEVVLMRNRIIQGFDLEQALNAAQALDINFVVMGTVSRVNGNIGSHIALVSSANRQIIADWNFSFLNQQDVLNRGKEIGIAVINAIQGFVKVSAQSNIAGPQANWLDTIKSEIVDGQSRLTWTVGPFAPEGLGFNVYRGLSEQGPFSYITSVLETEYVDDISGLTGGIYYQVALLTDTGEEFRSNQIAHIVVSPQIESNLAAPAILSVTHLLKGVEIVFLPSAQNVGQPISAYQLVRRKKGQAWSEVNRIPIDNTSSTKNKNDKSATIQQYTLVDAKTQSIDGPVEYAVRAIDNEQAGKASDPIYHVPVSAPSLIDTGVVGVRQALLKWQPVEVGQGYHIYRRDAAGKDEWQQIATIEDLQQASYIDNGFTAENQSFQYAINVYDQYSSSTLGEPLTLTSRGPLKAPTNFQVENGLAHKVILNWQGYNDPALKGYAIFRAPFSNQTDITLQKIAEVLEPSAHSYTDQAIDVDGSSFYYAVAALNTFSSSGDLTPVQKGTSKEPPPPVAQFTALVEPLAVKLTWTANDNTVSNVQYRIERRWQQTTWQQLATVDGQTFTYSDEQLLPQAEVEYRISVVDVDNLVSLAIASNQLKTLNVVSMLPQPDGLLRQINLAWQGVSSAEKLQILRRQDNEDWKEIALLEGNTQNYQDTTELKDDTQYEYKLAVIYAGQTVSHSDVIRMKTKNIPAPSELKIVSGKAKVIILQWPSNHDPDLKSTIVYRASKTDNYTSYQFLSEIPLSENSTFTDAVDTGSIEHGEVYRYALASRNIFDAIGPIGLSVEGYSKKLPASASALIAKSSDNAITLTWQTGDETDLKSANIYRRWSHDSQWYLLEQIQATNHEYIDAQLLPYATAEYKITLTDAESLTSKDSLVVSALSPLTIELKAASQGLLRKNALSWTANNLVDSYKILRSENNITWQEVVSLTQNDFVDDKNLLDEKRYFYKVSVLHKGQQLGQSNTIEVNTKALPLAPANFTAKSAEVKKVSLSWTTYNDSDVGGYIVYRLLDNGKLDELERLKLTEGHYVDEGGFFSKLEHGTQYQYVISAFNRFKVEGPKSQPVSATTKGLPAAVANFKGMVAGNAVALNWQANSEGDINQYIVYRGKSCSRASKLVTLSNSTTSYADNTVESGNDYCYYIIALDLDSLESEASKQVNINLPASGGQ
jgi:fibronectin type 3 domain-containing protein